MNYFTGAVVSVLIVAVLFALLWAGWRGRMRRQDGLAAPPEVPGALGEPMLRVGGQYVTTTSARDWLDRIAVRQLGIRTNADLSVHPEGVLFDRAGAPALFIPADSLDGVRLESGMAGKFVEKDGLVVLSWQLGDTAVDTGFRTRAAADKALLVRALEDLMLAGPDAGAGTGAAGPRGTTDEEKEQDQT
jgi:hypothetical protein